MEEFLRFEYVRGTDENFMGLCKKLEEFQFNLMPELKQKGYNLTDDLKEVEGFVLFQKNDPIASIGLKKVNDKRCEIVRVFVREDFRGNGFARLLFKEAEDYARECGFEEVEMVAWTKSVSALKLYHKLNYEFSDEKESEWFDGLKYVELFKKLN